MASYVGISNNNPIKYLGPDVSLVSIVTRNRAPTGADIRQGTTGRYYPVGSDWIISKNPTTGAEGDKWYLSKIVANVAYWVQYENGILPVEEFVTDVSGPVFPTAGGIVNLTGSTTTYSNGSVSNTVHTEVQGAAHSVFIGNGSLSPASVITPSSTVGVPLISQGLSADPIYGAASVPGGGTGATSFTPYTVITAGTTSTAALTNVSGVGTSGQVLTSNGPSSYPTWQSTPSGVIVVAQQVFTNSGTYTPTAGMVYCTIEILGGGGAGGGAPATGAGQFSIGGGGGGGEYARGIFSAATIGASKTVTIGAGGTGNSGATGGNGGTTSVVGVITAVGGSGGVVEGSSGPASDNVSSSGGLGGTGGTGGNFRCPGQDGDGAIEYVTGVGSTAQASCVGRGGCSQFGSGGSILGSRPATGYGAGGAGQNQMPSSGALTGLSGTAGLVLITEYI